jgi:hypothetical protein
MYSWLKLATYKFLLTQTLHSHIRRKNARPSVLGNKGVEKTLDISRRAEGTEGGRKYVMNSCMICTPHNIIRVTKYRGMRCRGRAYSKSRTPPISRKSTFGSVFTRASYWWLP